ncbi:MAG: hypothetical protein ETSY1_34145 [Candidatus Entotheonella factor]|uniref:Metallo-beta-lactamase domain-containing protein n=1 Tax=Entotheonella factor TaxID=1429438 RepID=W4LA64_ENTF1|nr:MAG: hypothetical protein ETSY1_34145 [Candidatus Entotheonella factor]
MQRSRLLGKQLLIFGAVFFIAFCSVAPSGGLLSTRLWRAAEAQTPPPAVSMTWMSVTNWYFEMNGIKIVTDGFISRVPRGNGGAPFPPDVEAVQRVLDAIGGEVDVIVAGHSHGDHTLDTAAWARLTGAQIIGARTTCLQALAQGIPESQCTIVEGGEFFDLGNGVTVRVVRWNHSGDINTPAGVRLQAPLELINAPVPDPVNGGLRPSILTDFPNGGGARAFLFSIDHAERQLQVFFANTGNAGTFESPRNVDEQFFEEHSATPLESNLEIVTETISARAHLEAAMADAGIDSVDVWLGIGFGTISGSSTNLSRFAAHIIQPRAYIPHHWDDFRAPSFFDGLTRAWTNEGLEEFWTSMDVPFFIQGQYMDKYILEPSGITFDINSEVKAALGLPDVAVIPMDTASEIEADEPECLCLHDIGMQRPDLPDFSASR